MPRQQEIDELSRLSPEQLASRVVMLSEALRDLLWAATERDRKNRIRQFDEFVDNATKALRGER